MQNQIHTEPYRKLSPWRVALAIVILAGLIASAVFGIIRWQQRAAVSASTTPWFASYVDVTATPAYAFEQLGTTTNKNVVLSFIVSGKNDACTPTWGGEYNIEQASNILDLDRRIARLQQQGGSVAISFGGLINDELAVKCTDESQLKAAYKSIIDHYKINTIDLDIEGTDLGNLDAAKRRAKVIAEIQKERREAGQQLAVWYTLPVTPLGLSEAGTTAVATVLAEKLDIAGINAMTMDYGQSYDKNQTMQAASESALNHTKRQLGILYEQAGIPLNDATLWSKIGATPMIGQNDFEDEVFTLDDAKGLNKFTQSRGIGRMSMWSANRDIACGSNYVDTKVVSDSCSGVKQEKYQFATELGADFKGNLAENAGVVTTANKTSNDSIVDDPATSPYPIWSENNAYLAGAKVVWRKNVYQAKWWTQGELPDNPVLQSWQTAWELVGPVLPGEKPVAQATLPEGTYPTWLGSTAYETGARVLFEGTPYQAKWWNQGNSPAAASSSAATSPWVPLTQSQINEVLQQKQ